MILLSILLLFLQSPSLGQNVDIWNQQLLLSDSNGIYIIKTNSTGAELIAVNSEDGGQIMTIYSNENTQTQRLLSMKYINGQRQFKIVAIDKNRVESQTIPSKISTLLGWTLWIFPYKSSTVILDRELLLHCKNQHFQIDRYKVPPKIRSAYLVHNKLIAMYNYGEWGSGFVSYNIDTKKWSVLSKLPTNEDALQMVFDRNFNILVARTNKRLISLNEQGQITNINLLKDEPCCLSNTPSGNIFILSKNGNLFTLKNGAPVKIASIDLNQQNKLDMPYNSFAAIDGERFVIGINSNLILVDIKNNTKQVLHISKKEPITVKPS